MAIESSMAVRSSIYTIEYLLLFTISGFITNELLFGSIHYIEDPFCKACTIAIVAEVPSLSAPASIIALAVS